MSHVLTAAVVVVLCWLLLVLLVMHVFGRLRVLREREERQQERALARWRASATEQRSAP